jgi:hypothetical protein
MTSRSKWMVAVSPETFAALEALVEERCQRTRSATDDDRMEEARRCMRQTRMLYEGKVPGLRIP